MSLTIDTDDEGEVSIEEVLQNNPAIARDLSALEAYGWTIDELNVI